MPAVADALDPDQVAEAVGRARPGVIVHELTALAGVDMRHLERDFALTNRLRTEGTDYLLSAGQAVGVRRFVAPGICGFRANRRTGEERGGSAITSISSIVNPDKLSHLGPLTDSARY
jgi:hypothetical protein